MCQWKVLPRRTILPTFRIPSAQCRRTHRDKRVADVAACHMAHKTPDGSMARLQGLQAQFGRFFTTGTRIRSCDAKNVKLGLNQIRNENIGRYMPPVSENLTPHPIRDGNIPAEEADQSRAAVLSGTTAKRHIRDTIAFGCVDGLHLTVQHIGCHSPLWRRPAAAAKSWSTELPLSRTRNPLPVPGYPCFASNQSPHAGQ